MSVKRALGAANPHIEWASAAAYFHEEFRLLPYSSTAAIGAGILRSPRAFHT